MPCPHRAQAVTAARPRRTTLGYRTFRCPGCRRSFNERTGTPFNHVQVPTDIVLLVVLWRLRSKRSRRDLAEAAPAQVTTDGHDAYPRDLGDAVSYRTSRYKNNRIEQDHRGVKQRYYPPRGFGSFAAAARCRPGVEALRQYFRSCTRQVEPISRPINAACCRSAGRRC